MPAKVEKQTDPAQISLHNNPLLLYHETERRICLMITDLQQLIETCKQELHDREYHAHHADMLTKEWDALLEWFRQKELAEFSQPVGYQYCDEEIGAHIIVEGMTSKQKKRLRAVRMLISYQQNGDFEFRTPRVERNFEGESGFLITQFIQHEHVLGRSDATIECRKMALYALNQYLTGKGIGFNELDVDTVEDFFKHMGCTLPYRHTLANHLRQLFHYLYDCGYTTTDNSIYVLKDQYRSQCKLPTTYTEEEISRVLSAVDRSSPIGKRDYLIILLAAEYGWRAGDIVRFRFSQIDWDGNKISFSQSKTDTPVEYPLLASVGNAIIDYLRHGRPESQVPEVIVSAEVGKHGTPLKPPTIHSVVSRYMRAANIAHWKEKRHGPHSLRHSLASNLLKNNVSIPVINTVLGHQRTETTKIYLKVDIDRLALCPLPLPKLSSPYYKEVNGE